MTPAEAIRIVILGVPVTKNGGGRLFQSHKGTTCILPPKRVLDWTASAVAQIRAQLPRGHVPWTFDVEVTALIYRVRKVGDFDNFTKAIGDALQAGTSKRPRGGVIKNDSQIESWDHTRKLIDRTNPRVEITIRPFVG